MIGYHDLGTENHSIAVIVLAVMAILAYSLLRIGKQRARTRRRTARRARRAEENRIWNERFGAK